MLNKSLIAFNTITDSIETGYALAHSTMISADDSPLSGKNLIQSSTLSTGVIVGHKFGPDAAHLSHQVGSSFKRSFISHFPLYTSLISSGCRCRSGLH